MFRRVILLPLVSAAALVLMAAPGSAAPAVPGGTPQELDLMQPCAENYGFQIEVVATLSPGTSEPRTTLPNGLLIFTGSGSATVTNTTTGKSATYNISGPYEYDPNTNRVFIHGTNLISNMIGEPFLWVTAGTTSFIFDQPFDQDLRGHVIHDVCAELAG